MSRREHATQSGGCGFWSGFGKALRLGRLALLATLGEARHHPLREQLERLTDVLVPVRPGLQHEDDLVDAGLLVAGDELGDLLRRPDRAAQTAEALLEQTDAERRLIRPHDVPREPGLVTVGLELAVHVGDAGGVVGEAVVVTERVAKEVGPIDPAVDRLVL